ncbi:MAG TPA: rhamnogalacturonan acetylesterase [Terracidiphilus sp.]|nr:rhamnogalacturonan acetylesterase [Terracidiphilus sp.]
MSPAILRPAVPVIGVLLFLFAAASGPAQVPDGESLKPPPTPQQISAAPSVALNPALPTVFIVGDSTARNQADLGWGDHLAHYFDTSRINVANRAIAGRSSRSYLQEGHWDHVLAEMKPGDYVLIQMGHNDGGDLSGPKARGSLKGLGDETQNVTLPNGQAETVHTYGWYIRKYIADTRAKGATPLLLSLTIRNIWTPGADGKPHIERDMGYDAELRQLSAEEHVPYIDMSDIEADRLEAMGPEKTALLFPKDHTHTSDEGAELNAQCVALALRQAQPPLASYLNQSALAAESSFAASAHLRQEVAAKPAAWNLTCSPTAGSNTQPLAGARYRAGAQDFGFDLAPSPQIENGSCTSDQAFFVSVTEPDGNYRVTVVLGSKNTAATAIKAEARRLMLDEIDTKPGKTIKRSFIVNVRTPQVSATEQVRLKPREVGSLDWDEKLTLEFSGAHPAIQSIEIEPIEVPTVYIAGDSTVVDQDKEPWAAWGQILPVFFNDRIAIANEAESGETIASFVGEHRFDKIFSTIHAGDYLLMQFAHNDQKPGRGFVSIPEYKDLLHRYIGLARERGAHAILVTSMNRRNFTPDGKIVPTLGDYPDAMREVAQEEHVPLIDLNAMSKTLFEAMGPEGTLKAFVHYPANTFPDQSEALADNTHFNSYGALELAKCVVQSVRAQHLPLAKLLRSGIPRFDPPRPDPASVWRIPRDPFLSGLMPYER